MKQWEGRGTSLPGSSTQPIKKRVHMFTSRSQRILKYMRSTHHIKDQDDLNFGENLAAIERRELWQQKA